jgi:hypothetical protein
MTIALLSAILHLAAMGATDASVESSVTGTVFDSSGAAVPDTALTLKATDGTALSTTTSDPQGAFSFDRVPSGRYEVEVSRDGFKRASLRVVVGARPAAPLRIVLEIAGFAEDVTVGQEALSTGSTENRDSVSVDRKLLDDLPVLDQDYVGALSRFLDPGSIDGGGVSLVVDGAEVSRVPVSASAIQEVRINQNPYSSEYFRPGRGRIEIVTKQGTPEYHGTVNLLFRDAALNARDFLAPERPPEQRRTYEGYLTGPVGKSRTTTFQISVERREDDLQSIVVATIPSGELRETVAAPQRSTDLSARVTRQIGTKHTVWAQYNLEQRASVNDGAGGFTLPEAAATSRYHEDNINLSDQFMASPKAVNQLFLHLEWNHDSNLSVQSGPKTVVQDAFTGGGAQADQRATEMDVKLTDTFSWTLGRHLLKAGLQVSEWSHRTYDDLSNRQGTFFYSSLADYEQGRPYAFTLQGGEGHVALFQQIVGGFVQDELQLTKRLSLAVGARYDYQNLFHDGRLAPRLFAAFAPPGSRKLLLRAGVGFFEDRFPPPAYADVIRYDGRHLRSYLLLDPTDPDPAASGLLATQPINLARLDPTIRTPTNVQYSFGAEWQITKAATLTATYRGDRGVALLRSRDVNAPPPPLYAERPDPSVGRVRQIESAGHQAGDGLELGFRGKIGTVFTGLAQYTFSRSHNNTGGLRFFPASSAAPLAEWGPADFDQRHRFNALGTVDVKGLMKIGLSVSAATGRPYTLTTGLDDNHDGLLNDRAAGVGRNTARLPGFVRVDARLARDVVLGRARAKDENAPTATLGLDVFNVLNADNASTIVGNAASPFFGQPVATLPARRVQLSARLSF